MQQRSRFTTMVRHATLPLILTGMAACRDANPTSPQVVPTGRPLANSVVADTSAWDTFVTDVVVRTDAPPTATGHAHHTPPPISYHLERTLKTDGRWTSTMTFTHAHTANANSAVLTPGRFEISRIMNDGEGGAPQLFNGLGQAVALSPALRPLPVSDSARKRLGLPDSLTLPRPSTNGKSARADSARSNRRWINTFILAPSQMVRRKARFDRDYGAAVRTADGLDQYTKQTDSLSLTVLVDPRIEAIVDLAEARGEVTRHTRFSYAIGTDTTAVLTEIQAQTFGPGNVAGPVLHTQFTNLHLEKRN